MVSPGLLLLGVRYESGWCKCPGLCMKGNCGPVWGINRDRRSACQCENTTDNDDSNFKAATWSSCLCLMTMGTSKTHLISQPTLLQEWQLQKDVQAPRVSALAKWTISVIILCCHKWAGTANWSLLDESLRWHLSVSGQPSVAPSISLSDSPGPGASLTSSLHQL